MIRPCPVWLSPSLFNIIPCIPALHVFLQFLEHTKHYPSSSFLWPTSCLCLGTLHCGLFMAHILTCALLFINHFLFICQPKRHLLEPVGFNIILYSDKSLLIPWSLFAMIYVLVSCPGALGVLSWTLSTLIIVLVTKSSHRKQELYVEWIYE